jgi:hypothetical protein
MLTCIRGVTSNEVCYVRFNEDIGFQFRFLTFRLGFEEILRAKAAARPDELIE